MKYAHGTYIAYTIDRCRCDDCRRANRDYERDLNRRRLAVKWGMAEPDRVDPAEAKAHIDVLRANGIGCKRIAELAGVGTTTIARLSRPGHPRYGWRLERSVAERILAVSLDAELAPSRLVSAGPTGRKVRALIAAGYPRLQMATAIGVQASNFRYADLEEWHLVKVRRAAQIDALYQQLSGMPGTSVRARNEGRRRGWPPPLAWDDIDAGVLADDEDVDASSCSTCDEIGHLAGVTPWPEIAARLGMGLHGMEAHLRRHGTHGRLLPEVYAEVAQLRRAPS